MEEVEILISENFIKKEKTLNLSGFGLKEIPRSVFDLVHLKELKLMKNKIRSIPSDISRLTQLSHLYLYDNKIAKIPKEELKFMPHLACLDLADNMVDYSDISEVYEELERNSDYGKLFDKVKMHDEKDKRFWFFGKINRLPIELFDLNYLEDLSISGGNLEIPKDINKLKKLTRLTLNGCQLTRLPEEFYEISSLEELYLDSNNFIEFPYKLLEMPSLKRISLNYNNILYIKKYMDKVVLDKSYSYFSLGDNPLKDFKEELFRGGLDYIRENVYGIEQLKTT